MKIILFTLFLGSLIACSNPETTHRQTKDSVALLPDAAAQEQIPGTPGAAGSDSTRPSGPTGKDSGTTKPVDR